MSLWLGVSIVTQQTETLLKVGVVIVLLVCAVLGARVWVLVPIMGAMGVPLLRGFSTAELGQLLFVGFAFLLFCMRRFPIKWRWSHMDWWVLAVVALILQVYFRNPVGLNIFGGSSVGGKPYFIVALAFITMAIFGMIRIQVADLKWVMIGTIIGGFMSGPLTALRRGGFGGGEGVGGSIESVAGMTTDTGSATRKGIFIVPAIMTARIVTAYVSPLMAMVRPMIMFLVLFSVCAAAYTGFRNTVAMVGLIMLAGIGYHGGKKAMLLSALLGVFGLGVLAVVNLVMPLPANMQRALSPFPGTWDERYLQGADRSTEWRLEMWKAALGTDEWIQNKTLGDGLGMTRAEYEKSLDIRESGGGTGMSGLTKHQENAMINGDYHSGPVQTVRTVGYVGLIMFMGAMIALARYAHQLILRCKGTPWFPIALFFGIPAVVKPVFFALIFGEFGTDAASFFLGTAMIKMLHANLPVPEYQKSKKSVYIPMVFRDSQTPSDAARA